MFTQVGVGALVVSYAIMGAFAFQSIEGKAVDDTLEVDNFNVSDLRTSAALRLWNVTDHHNVLNKTKWYSDVLHVLFEYQGNMTEAIKKGYDGQSSIERWTFPSALMFSLSVFTMIGFGHLVPRTTEGKIATMLYAVVGIPVYVLYFMNMGQVLASLFKWFYCKLVSCADQRKNKGGPSLADGANGVDPPALKSALDIPLDSTSGSGSSLDEDDPLVIIVPSTACLWVWLIYLLVGTIMFAEWENWPYLDACYFCVTSLCKIGMGDFVPGKNAAGTGSQTKLIINFVYLLVGMGVIAMCYSLMKEEVLLRLREFKADMIERLQDIGVRIN